MTGFQEVAAATPALLVIGYHLTAKDVLSLAQTCKMVRKQTEALVAAAHPDMNLACKRNAPPHLRIPLLKGLKRSQVLNRALYYACIRGCLREAKWLAAEYGLHRDEVLINDMYPFRGACGHGRLAVAKWIADEYEPTRESVMDFDNCILYYVCDGGHLEVAKWLVARYKMEQTDKAKVEKKLREYGTTKVNNELTKWLAEPC